jgi:hypothetical protein
MSILEIQITEFWKFSEKKPSEFNFKLFMDEFTVLLENKLARHGQLTYEQYIDSISPLYDFNTLELFVYNSEHTNSEWNLQSIQRLIFYPRYEHFRDIFKNNERYIKLLALYHKILDKTYDNEILLVDECIHCMHNSGFLIDIESLRKEYES